MYKSIIINEELHRELKLYCVKHGVTISSVVRNALDNILSQKYGIAGNLEKNSAEKSNLTKERGELNREDYT